MSETRTYRVTLYAADNSRHFVWQIEAPADAPLGAVAAYARQQHDDAGHETVRLPSIDDVEEITA